MKNESNQQKYKRLASFYDRFMNNRWFNHARKKEMELASVQPGQHVLLVGVGTGIDIDYLPENIKITGIDLSVDMLEICQRKIGNRNIHLQKMGAEKLGFKDETFDLVFMNLILSVVEDPKKALAEACRVLKTEGSIWILDKFRDDHSRPGWVRRSLNILTSFIGTDINRSLGEMADGIPLTMVYEEPVLGSFYKIVQFKKAY